MKINNKKIIVSTLALAMGAALAGSISGSVAWYQYSTRTTASMTATSAGTVRNLRIATSDLAVNSNQWSLHLNDAAIKAASAAQSHSADGNLSPVAAVYNGTKVTGFKAHPVYQYPDLPDALGTEYLQFDLYFESLDKNGDREDGLDIYLTKLNLTISDSDIESALRIAFLDEVNTTYYIGSVAGELTKVSGKLDLNANGVDDKDGFAADDSQGSDITYGDGATNYTPAAFSSLVANDNDAYAFSGGEVITKTDGSKNAKITVMIWLEGWQEVTDTEENIAGTPSTNKCIWDADLIGETISIDMRFAVEAEQ